MAAELSPEEPTQMCDIASKISPSDGRHRLQLLIA